MQYEATQNPVAGPGRAKGRMLLGSGAVQILSETPEAIAWSKAMDREERGSKVKQTRILIVVNSKSTWLSLMCLLRAQGASSSRKK
jgi:hypothetical protein